MLDLITLSILFFCTTGISYLLWFLKIWPAGIWWGSFWFIVTATVLAFEGLSVSISGRTLTRHIRQWAKERTLNLWIARGIVISFLIGSISLCLHLWPM